MAIVVVVFYWLLGSKQISRSIYIHITHTKHGKKLTSAHQSNKEINIASVSVDFVWYNRDFFYISIAQNFMKRASPVLALGPRKFPGTGANSRPARPSGTRSQSPSKCLCHHSSFWRRFVTYAIFLLTTFSRQHFVSLSNHTYGTH